MNNWWVRILFGLGLLAFSVYMYFDLTNFEAEGGTRRMRSLIALLYNIGGKWAVVLVFGLGGAAFLFYGLKDARGNRADGG